MNGLLRNNLYATASNAKVFAGFMLLFGVFAVAVISQSIQFSYLLCAILGFTFHAAAILKNESACKWGKYKLTLPVKRAQIVISLYGNHLVWMLVGVLCAGAEIALSWLIHGCPFDRHIDALSLFALAVSMSLFMGAIFFPFVFLIGEEKGDTVSIISLLCALAPVLAIIGLWNRFLNSNLSLTVSILLGSLTLVGSAALVFMLSCLAAIQIFRRKEC